MKDKPLIPVVIKGFGECHCQASDIKWLIKSGLTVEKSLEKTAGYIPKSLLVITAARLVADAPMKIDEKRLAIGFGLTKEVAEKVIAKIKALEQLDTIVTLLEGEQK